MKQTITLSMFRDAFRDYGRNDNFSREGLEVLFNWITELESDTGTETELDVIALCCDWSEIRVSDIERETGADDLDDLRDKTTVLEVDDETIIYGAF